MKNYILVSFLTVLSSLASANTKATQCEFREINLSIVNNDDIRNNISLLENCIKTLRGELTHKLIIRSGGINYEERMNKVRSIVHALLGRDESSFQFRDLYEGLQVDSQTESGAQLLQQINTSSTSNKVKIKYDNQNIAFIRFPVRELTLSGVKGKDAENVTARIQALEVNDKIQWLSIQDEISP